MKSRFVNKIVCCAAIITIFCAGTTMAYFTDSETLTNTFTVGKIAIELQEPNWTEENATNIVPNQEIRKDPQIKNIGTNDAYVFLEVKVPCAEVSLADADGTKESEKKDTELFCWEVNEGWMQIGTVVEDETANTHTYIYAYGRDTGMTILEKDVTTPALFNAVKFVNIVEDEGLEETVPQIAVNAYAVQADNLFSEDDTIDGDNAPGKVRPVDVWEVLDTQILEQ